MPATVLLCEKIMGGSREGTGGPGDPGAKTVQPGKSQVL